MKSMKIADILAEAKKHFSSNEVSKVRMNVILFSSSASIKSKGGGGG